MHAYLYVWCVYLIVRELPICIIFHFKNNISYTKYSNSNGNNNSSNILSNDTWVTLAFIFIPIYSNVTTWNWRCCLLCSDHLGIFNVVFNSTISSTIAHQLFVMYAIAIPIWRVFMICWICIHAKELRNQLTHTSLVFVKLLS